MKRHLLTIAILMAATVAASAQTTFPGISADQKKELATIKKSVAFALPTWLPAGFNLTQVQAAVGRKVKIEKKELIFVYSRDLPEGKLQRFAFEAGFDGIGDLMYEGPRALRLGVGKLQLFYQPKDEDGKKIADFAMTEWFDVGGTAFHYTDNYGSEEQRGEKLTMLSLADTERMLRSLKRY